MSSFQGPVICPTSVHAKQTSTCTPPINALLVKAKFLRSRFWGLKRISYSRINMGRELRLKKGKFVTCSFSSSSNGNGSRAERFSENDADYINSSILEAVEVKSGPDGFVIKMHDGRYLKCVHNNPQGGSLPNYAPHPAIVLKTEDGTGLVIPIIVLEIPSVLLMAAMQDVPIARPTMYDVVKEMIEKMGYSVKLVRVTKRVHEAYFSRIYLSRLGNETECVSFDLRPSDAINIAVRCKVPIQVNKYLAFNDGMRIIDSATPLMQRSSDGLLSTELDRPSGQSCIETKEFNILRSMLVAAVEERYRDAALLRDELKQLRSKKN